MVIAAIYVAVITQLPNRAYYDYLRDMDSANLQRVTSNVFIYSVLELLSLVILDAVIRWRLKFSLLTQLAFVQDHHLQARALDRVHHPGLASALR
jgi:hypothetical protein